MLVVAVSVIVLFPVLVHVIVGVNVAPFVIEHELGAVQEYVWFPIPPLAEPESVIGLPTVLVLSGPAFAARSATTVRFIVSVVVPEESVTRKVIG